MPSLGVGLPSPLKNTSAYSEAMTTMNAVR
jgi:hypothetical protein